MKLLEENITLTMKKKEICRFRKYGEDGFKNISLQNYMLEPNDGALEIDFFSFKENTIGRC